MCKIYQHKTIRVYVFLRVSLLKSHDHAVQEVKKSLGSEGFGAPRAWRRMTRRPLQSLS